MAPQYSIADFQNNSKAIRPKQETIRYFEAFLIIVVILLLSTTRVFAYLEMSVKLWANFGSGVPLHA